jgi:ribonuclease BN (tRNA processing enzyme)
VKESKGDGILAELIMLGTGIAMVTRCYNTCFAIKNDEEYFLVDAGGGNGIMGQLEKAGISYEKMILHVNSSLWKTGPGM